MPRYFSFRAPVPLPGYDHDRDVLVVSQGLQGFEPGDLTSILETSLEQGALPDDVLLLVPEAAFQAMVNACRSDTSLRAALERGQTIWSRTILGMDGYGHIGNIEVLSGSRPFTESQLPMVHERVVAAGLGHIALKQEVLKRAPPGCVFVKPSGDVLDVFLLAADLFHSESEIAFIASAVLQRLGGLLDSARTIYVDTMAMQPLARAIVELARASGRNVSPAVESFHSYTGLARLRPETPDRLLCLISASTSGALARKFAEKTRCTGERVLTCLDVVDDRDESHVLINAQKLFRIDLKGRDQNIPGAARVQLAGEFFASTACPPRSIVLTMRHSVADLKAKLTLLLNTKVIALDYAAPRADRPRAVAIDGDALLSVERFVEWVRKRIRWSVPGSVRWIVHADDPVSERLSARCDEIMGESGLPKPLGRINASQLTARETIATDDGILIVSAVARSGTQLASIGRDLRTFAPNSTRVYLVGCALPVSLASYRVAEANLRKGPKGWDYAVDTWCTIPIGHADGMSSWDEERRLLAEVLAEGSDDDFTRWAQTRFESLGSTGVAASGRRFNTTTAGAPLQLRPEFVLLDNKEPVSDPAIVYAAIAATLQNARENENLPQALRLRSSDFEQVLLSPECFNRFNDGVIQAALLRAAYPMELDYSCSTELSADMSRIVGKILQHHRLERGEAALEFALALATKRVRLVRGAGQRLLSDELLQFANNTPALRGLLKIAREWYS